MQAPKESLDAAIAANWATAQADPPPVQDPSFVTGNSPTHADKYMTPEGTRHIAQKAAKAREDMFARGMREGADPFIFSQHTSENVDAVTYRMGTAEVTVSGLEMIQAEDPEALGYAKGQRLRLAYCESNPAVAGRVSRETAQADVGQGVSAQDVGMGSKRDMPPLLQMTISQQFLSEVLHELAGMASMCWTLPPKGVFDAERCLSAVAYALKRLAPEPSPHYLPRTPNNDEVICPACTHQFGAIPVNVQARIKMLEDMVPMATPLTPRSKTG